MRGPVRWGRRGLGAALVAAAAVLGLVVAPACLDAARAGFSASTGNPGDALSADRLLPPAEFTVTQACAAPPAVAFRAVSTAVGSESLTVPIPAGTVAGDVLLAQVVAYSTTASVPVPAGWSQLRRDVVGTSAASVLYTKSAVTGESSPTFSTAAGSGTGLAGGILAYSGVYTTTPTDGSAAAGASGSTVTLPAVTTTTANTVLVRFITNTYEVYPAPASTTSRWAFGSGLTAVDEPFVGPGTAGARSATSPSGTSAPGLGQTVALRPGPPTPSAVLSWTATPSTWADGYRGDRQPVVPGASTLAVPLTVTSITDPYVTNGVTYTYHLMAYRRTWTSAALTATLTPNC